jgi:ABC-type multidrug transport system fused ATPase/permease subunit
VVEVAQNLTVAIILGYGFRLAAVGTFYIFIDYMRRFFMPLRDLSAKYAVMQSSMAGAERIFQLLDTEPAIVDRAGAGPEPPSALGTAAAPRGSVEFENVWLAYNEEEWVLEDVSFRVEPGERVAFVGATGAGKTSLIKLLTRLYEPQRGRVLLDGQDVCQLPQSEIRRRVATVLQDVFLFSGTVADNISLGRQDLDADQIERAARTVEAHTYIETLPQGYQTELRERGADLSAGQRQLLSFARAVAHGSDVLVLDEATSSIDTETEQLIQRGIHKLMEGRTAMAVAHRLSTIQDVDRIYVLHRGRIVEFGSHEELMALEGFYYRLYRLQYRTERAIAASG